MKKIISLFTAAVLLVSMSLATFAATPGVPYDVDTKNFQTVLKANGAAGFIKLDKKSTALDKLSDLKVSAGSVIKIYLTDTMFVDNQGSVIGDPAKPKVMTRAQVRGVKLTLRRSTSRGSNAIKTFGIKYDNTGAYINMEFVDPFKSVDDLDFSTTIYMVVNGKRKTGTNIPIAGTIANDVVEVYTGDDYVDLSSGQVAEAVERATNIEVDLGNDLSIFTNMAKGKKYYATCTTEVSTADAAVINKYPAILEVYTLSTLNIRGTADKVKFNSGAKLYAYNAAGTYLGTTDKALAISTKYYLSERKYTSLAIK